MRKRWFAALLPCVALACLLLGAEALRARDDTPEEIARRRNPERLDDEREQAYYAKQFRTKCARCHGKDGSGKGPEAAKQEIPPQDLTDASYMVLRTDGQLFDQILRGGQKSAMPAFGPGSDQGWSESKVWHMVAYVRTLARPAATPPSK